ncbi:11193_t:CDS:2, partial [Racocetra fulgida]
PSTKSPTLLSNKKDKARRPPPPPPPNKTENEVKADNLSVSLPDSTSLQSPPSSQPSNGKMPSPPPLNSDGKIPPPPPLPNAGGKIPQPPPPPNAGGKVPPTNVDGKIPPPPPLPNIGGKIPPAPPPPNVGGKIPPAPPPPNVGGKIPPPPPLPNVGGGKIPPPPPLPSNADSKIPLPPPPPNSSGKIPLPPPPPTSAVGNIPSPPSLAQSPIIHSPVPVRLPPISTNIQLKPLLWDKIPPNKSSQTVWVEIPDGDVPLDTEELEFLFSKNPISIKSPVSPPPKKSVFTTLIDINHLVREYTGDVGMLGNAEKYFREVMEIPRLSESETKALENNPKGFSTLLHYLAATLEEKQNDLISFMDELKHLEGASKISYVAVMGSVASLSSGADQIKEEIRVLNKIRLTSNNDRFCEIMEGIKEFTQQLEEKLKQLLIYYGEDPSIVKPEEFFGMIVEFGKSLAAIRRENEEERKRIEKEQTNSQSRLVVRRQSDTSIMGSLLDGKDFDSAIRDLRSGLRKNRDRPVSKVFSELQLEVIYSHSRNTSSAYPST